MRHPIQRMCRNYSTSPTETQTAGRKDQAKARITGENECVFSNPLHS